MKEMLLAGLLLACCPLAAQVPFEREVNAFAEKDQLTPPPAYPLLFTGSSSFTLWDNLQASFPEKVILNRAFGGSTFSDLLRHFDRIIVPYQPKQIVVYCGENDIAAGKSVANTVADFKTFFKKTRRAKRGVPFLYVAMKPSPARWELWPRYQQGNRQIKRFLFWRGKTRFVSMADLMTDPGTHRPRPEIFKADSLHMNHRGYVLWQKRLQPLLK